MYKYILSSLIILISHCCFSKDIIIKNIRLSENSSVNRIVLDLNSEAPFSSFILDNKPRLVIDVEAQKIKKVKIKETSLIIGLRIGNTDPGVFRLVFDLKKGAYIKKSFFLKKTDDKPNRIVIDLVSTEKKT